MEKQQIDTIVLVKDINASKTFYRETIGLELLHDWESMVIFRNRLALHQADLVEPKEIVASFLDLKSIGSSNLIIYIGTVDISVEFARLQEKGVEFIHGIVELPWQKIFRIRDIDGYVIEIGEEKST